MYDKELHAQPTEIVENGKRNGLTLNKVKRTKVRGGSFPFSTLDAFHDKDSDHAERQEGERIKSRGEVSPDKEHQGQDQLAQVEPFVLREGHHDAKTKLG